MSGPPAGRPPNAGLVLVAALSCGMVAVAGCAGKPLPAPEVLPPPAAGGAAPEAFSLLGEPLHRPELDAAAAARLEADLEQARLAHAQDPHGEETVIWLGRRLSYLGRYNEAIAVYSRGLVEHPRSYRLLRHRGHRFLTIRRLDLAVADLERATALIGGVPDEVEPDGAPNPAGIPRSTSHANIYYHLGLAHYVRGDHARAADAYRRCLKFSAVNDDMLCATSYWLYLALRRSGADAEAKTVLTPIRPGMEILENSTYHRLLLMFQGAMSADQIIAEEAKGGIDRATLSYGIGAWRILQGDDYRAVALFREIVSGTPWPAFAHLAAEAELAGRERAPVGHGSRATG